MTPLYLVILFDEAKEPVPDNSKWEYVGKNRWQSLQDDIMKSITMENINYDIIRRRSFRMNNQTGATMVLVIDIKKK